MSCENCPEPTVQAQDSLTEHCLMPRGFDLAPILAQLGVKADDIIKDWMPCTWKLVIIKGSDIKIKCVMRLDTSQCVSCPNRRI